MNIPKIHGKINRKVRADKTRYLEAAYYFAGPNVFFQVDPNLPS
jgi:hypothetical protein